MRNLIFALPMVLLCLNGMGQAQIGVVAGGNLSNVSWKQFSDKNTTRLLPGYQVGLTVTSPASFLDRHLHIQPGLFFSRKGFRQSYSDYLGTGDYKVAPYYLELPVNFLYLIPNPSDKNVFVGLGPYIAYGLGGQWEIDYDRSGGRFVGDIEYADTRDQRPPQYYIGDDTFNYGKRLDYGGNLVIGYELWGNMQLQAHGQLGLRNLAPRTDGVTGNGYFKNISFGLSVGYLL